MRSFGRIHRDRLATAAALLLPLAVAAVLLPWRSSIPNTDMALLLVVTVVAVAANGNRAAGILAAVSAAVWFDFFWTVPYQRFTITRHTDIETTVLLLAVGGAVSELAARGRRARRVAVLDTAYLAALRSTSTTVADGCDAREVVEQVQAQLVALLGLRAARFERGRLLGHPPRINDDGALTWGTARWNIDEHGFPDEDIELPARSDGRTHGRFLFRPEPGSAPSPQARQVAVMLAN
jgi:K+-sensing histidine kinase KdpD